MRKRKYYFFLAVLSLVLIIPQEISSAKTRKIKLSKKNVILHTGESCKVKLKAAKKSKIKWHSSNKKIVKVKNGSIKAINSGECIVTAKYKGKRYECDVVVKGMDFTFDAPIASPKLPIVKEPPIVPDPMPSEGSGMDYNFSDIKNFEDITFDVQIAANVLCVKIKNNSGTDITIGKDFVLEYYNNSQWEIVKTRPGSFFEEVVLLVRDGSEYMERIDLSKYFEELAAGKYRITKVVRANNEGNIQSEFTIVRE